MAKHRHTEEAYGEFQRAYDHFNRALFDGCLPPCLITLHRESKRTYGYFSHQRFVRLSDGKTVTDEIAMNPLHFGGRNAREVLSTLAHEMVHLWQAHHGRPSRTAYHNKHWAAKMDEIGLQPSSTGAPGGKRTGQTMSHTIRAGGSFARATAQLMVKGFMISWADAAGRVEAKMPGRSGRRNKYVCRECSAAAWGKGGLKLICGDCDQPMQAGGTSDDA